MDPHRTAISFCENLKITASLRGLYDPKCVFLFGHRDVNCVITGNLEKDAAVGSALVGLAGGMLKTRPKFRAGGDALFVANRMTDRLQRRLMRIVHFNVGENRKVISGAEAVQASA